MDSTILRNCALVGGSNARDCNGQSEILSFVNIPLEAADWIPVLKGVFRAKSGFGGGLGCSRQLSSSADFPFLECQLPKLDVAGSIPVSRSNLF
jgi:hypothetical protein